MLCIDTSCTRVYKDDESAYPLVLFLDLHEAFESQDRSNNRLFDEKDFAMAVRPRETTTIFEAKEKISEITFTFIASRPSTTKFRAT